MENVGIDIVEIARIKRVVDRYGNKFIPLIYTTREQNYCKHQPERLAILFAVKEAVSKALGTGLGYISKTGILPLDVEILFIKADKLLVRLHGDARLYCNKFGLSCRAIGLWCWRAHAIALVVFSTDIDL